MRVTYYEVFPHIQFGNKQYGLETNTVVPDDADEETIFKELDRLTQLTGKYIKSRYPEQPPTDFYQGFQPEKFPTASDILNPHEGIRLQKLIEECKTPEELDKLYDEAVRYGLSPTWDKKLKTLQNK